MTTTTIDLTDVAILKLTLRAAAGGVLTVTVLRAGVPVNITGATIKYYAKMVTPIEKTVGSGITITVPLAGEFELAFVEGDTSAQNHNVQVKHECKIQLVGEAPALLFDGVLTVEESLFTDML